MQRMIVSIVLVVVLLAGVPLGTVWGADLKVRSEERRVGKECRL